VAAVTGLVEYIMETHFVRRPRKFQDKLENALEGVVYQQTPLDKLVIRTKLAADTLAYYDRHPEDGRFTLKDIDAAINGLAKRGFLLEINGVRLERWLETVEAGSSPAGPY
jgi:hypothetical protein